MSHGILHNEGCHRKEETGTAEEVLLRTAQLLGSLCQRTPRHQPQRQHPGQCWRDRKMSWNLAKTSGVNLVFTV